MRIMGHWGKFYSGPAFKQFPSMRPPLLTATSRKQIMPVTQHRLRTFAKLYYLRRLCRPVNRRNPFRQGNNLLSTYLSVCNCSTNFYRLNVPTTLSHFKAICIVTDLSLYKPCICCKSLKVYVLFSASLCWESDFETYAMGGKSNSIAASWRI